MLTIRQVERLWNLKAYKRLIDELSAGRAEAVGGIRQLLDGASAAAALTVIRMTELNQSYQPHVGKMVRFLLAAQDREGSFGDAVCTALAVRALATGRGAGAAMEAGLRYLDRLQRDDGEWPREPFRRFEGDPAVTAFVMLQLVESRLDAARTLVNRTLDRLAAEPAPVGACASAEDALPAHEPLLAMKPSKPARIDIDKQLLPLRRRVASQAPDLVGSWS